jgi:hypothetical protein
MITIKLTTKQKRALAHAFMTIDNLHAAGQHGALMGQIFRDGMIVALLDGSQSAAVFHALHEPGIKQTNVSSVGHVQDLYPDGSPYDIPARAGKKPRQRTTC